MGPINVGEEEMIKDINWENMDMIAKMLHGVDCNGEGGNSVAWMYMPVVCRLWIYDICNYVNIFSYAYLDIQFRTFSVW